MRPRGGPRNYRRFLKPGPIVVASGLIAFAAWFVYGRDGLWERHKLAVRYELQAAQIAGLQQEKVELERYLSDLTAKEPAAMEQAARNYHMVAPGELIYEVKVQEPQPPQ
ncbi:septum formation initiator family protein [candidate division KSB1 bacterium]|nr:septum formation initiator family protein [candidate division KSB1 bacterium]